MHDPADDPRRDAARLREWLQRSGFAPAEPTPTGEARWVRPPGDARAGLSGQATEVRLSRGAGGDLEIGFFDPTGATVPVDDRAFAPVGPLTAFVDRHCRTGPAAALARAGRRWRDHIERGGRIVVSLGDGASVAAGLGLAALIRRGAVHAIVCGGGELEGALSALMARDGGAADPAELADLFEPLWAAIADGLAPLSPAEAAAEARRLLFAEQPHLRARRQDSWICAALESDVPLIAPDWGDGALDRALAAFCVARAIAPSRILPGRAEAVKALAAHIERPEDHGCVWLGAGQGILAEAAGWADAAGTAEPWGWTCRVAASAPAATYAIASDLSLAAPLLFGYVLDA